MFPNRAEPFFIDDWALIVMDMPNFIKLGEGQGVSLMACLDTALRIIIDHDFFALQACRMVIGF